MLQAILFFRKMNKFLLAFGLTIFLNHQSFALEVQCAVTTGGSTAMVSIKPTIDVYDYSMLDTPNGFRFSAQVNLDIDKLKTYVYYKPKSKFFLITQQNFTLSEFSCNKAVSSQIVYGGRLEQELSVACIKLC